MFGAASLKLPATLALLLLLGPEQAPAAGALAIGATEDLANGYSIGIAINARTEDEARNGALAWCRANGSTQTQARCAIVETFHNQCVAEANDPAPGTPGAGWGVGPSQTAAEAKAMDMCLATAQYCFRISIL